MPDFDKNLQPIIRDNSLSLPSIDVKAPKAAQEINIGASNFPNPDLSDNDDDVYKKLSELSSKSNFSDKGIFVTDKTLKDNQRYKTFNPIVSNQEDYAAYNQSILEKGFNGVVKGANLAATTIAGGFGMLAGATVAPFTGRLADIWDNPIMRGLDEWNTKVDQEYLPNYYTDAEKNAAWYSTNNWFTANFLFDKLIKNSGYAVGAMVSGNIANSVIGATGKALGTLAARAATASEASQAFKLFTPLLRNTARGFSAGKNIEIAAQLEEGVTSIADLTAKSSKIADLAKSTNAFAKFNDAARRTVISAYSSAGEASFEALQTANEYRNNLIEKYKQENYGIEPTGAELDKINEESEKVGKTSFFGNLALLTVTEFQQLPYLIGSTYKNTKSAANALAGKVDDVLLEGGQYIKKPGAATKFGKLYQKTKNVGQYVFDPKEGAQEIGQYALQVGTNNYFNKANEGEDVNIFVDGFLYGLVGTDETGKDVGALVSKEGIEGGVLGAITGGLMQARGNYVESKELKSNTDKFISSLNTAPSFKEAFKDKLTFANRAVVLQKQQEEAIASGEELEAKDIKADLNFNYLAPRIKYGRFDMVMEDINELKQFSMTKEGLASLKQQGLANINDTIPSYQNRLTNFQREAEVIQSLYESTNLRYSGELLKDEEGNPILNSNGEALRKYSSEVIDKMVYAASKIANYDVRIPQVNSSLLQYSINTLDVLQGIIENDKPNKEATEEALKQINSLDTTSEVKDELKTQLSDVIELSLRRKLFIEEYDDIKKNPLRYIYSQKRDDKVDTSPVSVEQKEIIEGKKKSQIKEVQLEVGKEYSLKETLRKEGTSLQLAPKITVLSKTLGGEYEVRLPNGKVKFLTPKEFKEYNISENDNTSEEFAKILDEVIDDVLKTDSSIEMDLYPGQTKLDYVNSLDNKKLINKIESEFNKRVEEKLKAIEAEEKRKQQLLKNVEQVKKEQTDIENNSGSVATVNTSTVTISEPEGKLKSAEIFFTSSISRSEDMAGEDTPHVIRSREFLNNANNLSNRDKLRAIIVTPKQAKALGLEGLVQLSYGVSPDTKLEDIPDALDVDNGFVAQVFVVQKGKSLFFVDKDGNELTKLGEQVDLNKVIFQTMPSTKITDSKGNPRYRSDQKEEFEAMAQAWRAYRKTIFNNPPTVTTSFVFDISRGIAIENKDADGNKEKNNVGGILIPEDKISTQQDLIIIPTTGSVVHKGQILKYPNGVPVLQFGDTLEFLNNKKFNNKEAKGIFQVIKALAEDIVKQSDAGKTIRINRAYSTYLQNVLFWKSKAQTTSDNQIRIDVDSMTLKLGKESYVLTEILNNESKIVSQLENAYHNVNGETLKKNFNEPFVEYYIDKQGNFTTSVWTNYQTYLLSSKYPTGESRKGESTPLTTSVAKPTESVPYSFKQKYSTLLGLEFPVVKVEEKAPEVTEVPKSDDVVKTKIGEYVIDGVTKNIYNLKNGPITFTANLDDSGNIIVSVEGNQTVQAIADNKTLVTTAIVPTLKSINRFDPTTSDEQLVLDYIALVISADLQKQKEAEVSNIIKTEEKKEETKKVLTRKEALKKAEEDWAANVDERGFPKESLQPILENINKEYDLLEGKDEIPKEKKPNKFSGASGPSVEYRLLGADGREMMTDAELQLFKEWHAVNVPNIPFEVLTNIITTANGEKAWGVFENGVAKFVKGGLRGTEYHEIGEAIWNGMLSPEEQQAILSDERSRAGEFKDRASGKTYSYDDPNVSDNMLKERIMDDFADYRLGKLPARSLGERIRRFFKMIMDFFKSFVTKPSLKQELFEAIDTGEFKDRTLRQSAENEFSEYRAVEGLTEQQTHEFIQDMTARAAGILYREGAKDLLFKPLEMTADQMFDQIRYQYSQEKVTEDFSKIDLLGEKAWKELKIRTKQSLRTLGISFDEGNLLNINNEESTSKDYAPEPFTTDWKKNSTGAIKFSLATLLETDPSNGEGALSLRLPAPKISSVGGYKLLNFSRAFSTVLDKLSNTTSLKNISDKLFNLSKYDPNYVRLFDRVGGNIQTGEITLRTNDDWRYFIQFVQTFTKQKPDALIQYKVGNEVYIAPANLYTAIQQTKEGWIENIKTIAQEKDSFITFNKSEKVYKVNEEKLKSQSIKTPKKMIEFLGNVGINFELDVYNNLKTVQKNTFAKAVSSIYTYLGSNQNIMSVTNKTLGVNGPISTLAELYNKVTNPNQESTYFGVDNQRIGSFSENNAPSVFENEFNEADTLDELLNSRPELKDIFSTNSQVLKKGGLFFDKDGNRIKEIKIGYIQGTKLLDSNKGFKTSKLGLGERFTQEINNNLEGNYYILLPGDSSTEWMMNMGNTILFKDVESKSAWKKIHSIFKGYLSDDIALALDSDNRKLKNIGSKGKELRFFKDILFDKELETINEMIEAGSTQEQIEEYVNSKEAINNIYEAIDNFINNTVKETRDLLTNNNQIFQLAEDQFSYNGLIDSFEKSEKLNKNKLSSDDINNILTFTNVNYIINNIEYHKILFGDPFQFAIKGGKLDETKRIKSFLSPRRTTFDSPQLNTFLNQEYNKVDGIELDKGDYGYNEFKSYTKTVTLTDVKLAGSLSNILEAYGATNEADAASWLMDNTYREVKVKNGQWSDEAEKWHQWQMAYTRQNVPGYKYTNPALEAHDKDLLTKPAPKHKIEVLKPIVSGNKFGENKFNLVLDKFSQMPIYYSMVKGTNLENLYLQMFNQGVGYAIVESGRKVGIDKSHSLYNSDGSFNSNVFAPESIVEVPWKAYGIQVETVSEEEKEQTRGSQLTKLSSMDLFDNGVPSSKEAKKEYERNMDILKKMHENAYNEILTKLGVEDLGNGFKLTNNKVISETLMYEMLRREVSDNTLDAIQLDENDQFRIPFEAAPSYLQIRNIIYSIIDKSIIRPKMNGGSHVQVPVTMFESSSKGRGLAMKTDKGWVKITREEYNKLSDEQKKDVAFTDDTLKFYTKESPYCEVMLPHWFKNNFKNKSKFPDDQAILDYLNKTSEGKSILTGIGFRIPTQALSSVEVFKVKGFLPQYMGSTVVVPSEITTKAGSDFDIDKLNMYLKSTYVDRTGDVRLVKYLGSEEATKDFYAKVFDDVLENRALKKSELFEALQIAVYGLDDPNNLSDKYSNLISMMLQESEDVNNIENTLMDEIEKLSDSQVQSVYKEKFVKDMYKKSLENEYYDSVEKLITLPENFERLISPVDDAGLEKLSEKLNSLRGYNEDQIKNRILNRNYMTTLRNTFVMAKKWVGIAAVNITNLSLKQKSKIYIDPERFNNLSKRDRELLGDGNIILKHNTVNINGQEYISLSGTTVKGSKELISNRLSGYATSFVDVANKPYITDIIQSDLVVGTFMFLENIGAGEQSAYFLNQPIITEYLKMLNSKGAKNLFDKRNINEIKTLFSATEDALNNKKATIDLSELENNIQNYSNYKIGWHGKGSPSDLENAIQQKIFDEFLKYAKMAEYAFKFTQATNYDTTSFKSRSAFTRKTWNTDIASKSNIISSVDNILDKTFIGDQKKLISGAMEATGAIFVLEQDDLKVITDSILRPFGENTYLSNDDFDKLANKTTASLLDYIIQTKTGLNSRIKELLVDSSTSVAVRLEKAKKDYPNIQLLKDLQVTSSNRPDGAKSIRLLANLKDAYDENLYTGMMRELRDYDDVFLNQLYKDLILVSILQGTYQSAISIKNIIPIEDYSKIVKPVLEYIIADESLEAFSEGMFHANNFKDDVVMPLVKPKFRLASYVPTEQLDSFGNYYADIYQYYSSLFPSIEAFSIKSSERKVLLLSEKWNSYDIQNDFIKVPRVVTNDKTGVSIDMVTGLTVTKLDYAIRKSKGDYSLNDVFGYAKVKLPDGSPLTTVDENGITQYVYKLINLYGDGDRASEYYSDLTKESVLENGTIKMNHIIPNEKIIEYYGGKIGTKDVSLPTNISKNSPEGLPSINRSPKQC